MFTKPVCTCGSIDSRYFLQLIATGLSVAYLPHIIIKCSECDKILETAKQTPEIIKYLNEQLGDMPL